MKGVYFHNIHNISSSS
ncbi:hypothetical protein PFFCH_05118 [Plasmodium falciparum FCH/4]|uniref:Uncharacterized protein n=1 Tax=Plasmodium falciparum FCH/4 TaxID=1036724 RepID=A0A024VHZ0_PLAFA|nr:hypothetical protein PFFCH_05118 [Plasmodium falciparum FCH/4]